MLYVNFAMVQYPIDEAQRLMYVSLRFDRFGQLTCLTPGLRYPTNAFKQKGHFPIRSYTIASAAQS